MSEHKHNDTINALKRLERAGDVSSETNLKLIEAAKTLLIRIDALVCRVLEGASALAEPGRVILPSRVLVHPAVTGWEYRHPLSHGVSGSRGGAGGDGVEIISLDRVDRAYALALGEAVADGLMDRLAEWSESRNQAAVSAASVMRKASEQI